MQLAQHGISLEALDLAPDFEHLTITGQLAVIEKALAGQPCWLIGSSLGGYLAALYAARHPEVDRLVLLAPAFNFYQLWIARLGPATLERWRETGTISVFHYGVAREIPLLYEFLNDARQYPAVPAFTQPCLIFHGLKDDVVPYEQSARFADNYSRVALVALDSGHEMTDVLDEIWRGASAFLLGPVGSAEECA
jgi:pimeloyl-ACP methyl ester carboxylesterase